MDGDEIEMSEEELQKWIREEVDKSEVIFPGVLEKCKMLQSLLKKREKQAAHLLKLCGSVAACEAIVKKQYSLLGWEYKDTYSDDDDNITHCGYSPPSPRDSMHSEMQDHHSLETNRPSSPQYSQHLNISNGKNSSACLMREAVVVLTRLPQHKICLPHPSTSEKCCDEDEPLSSSDSDTQWEPDNDSSDSDYSTSASETGSKKRRKIDEKNKKIAKSGATSQKSSNTEAKSSTTKTSRPQANSNTNTKKSTAKPSSPKTSKDAKTLLPKVNRNANIKSNESKMSSTPKNTNGEQPMCVSAHCQSNEPSQKTSPSVQQEEISVNMHVLARKRELNWQRGEILEILKKDDGRTKYKVNFEEKGKSLVSGHHIAFDCMPKVQHLVVGSRVVIKCPDNNPPFCPGILAELPSRKNRMRFLVFTDDHKPVYISLPLLHLVCRPLKDPLDDIPDDAHRNFLKDYLKRWPYPCQTQYKVGQTINVELNGIQERCEVQAVDCSLMQVLFQKGQQKEWIYRGSMRLEHMVNMKENLDMKRNLASTKA